MHKQPSERILLVACLLLLTLWMSDFPFIRRMLKWHTMQSIDSLENREQESRWKYKNINLLLCKESKMWRSGSLSYKVAKSIWQMRKSLGQLRVKRHLSLSTIVLGAVTVISLHFRLRNSLSELNVIECFAMLWMSPVLCPRPLFLCSSVLFYFSRCSLRWIYCRNFQ